MLLFFYLNLLFFYLKTIVEHGRSMVFSPALDENRECKFPLRKMLKKVIISQFNYSIRLIIKREPLDGEMANEPHASPIQKKEIIKVVITVTTCNTFVSVFSPQCRLTESSVYLSPDHYVVMSDTGDPYFCNNYLHSIASGLRQGYILLCFEDETNLGSRTASV